MNGLELTKAVREDHPEMEIVIFSGYNDFSYAREALRYGVVDYVLKPVDPNEFHKTFQRVMENISSKEEKQKQQNRKEDYLKKYFFLRYLYSGKEEDFVQLEKLTDETEDDVSQFSRMVLVSASNGFFETEEEHFLTSLKEEVQREFYYVNLNSNESIFLFAEKYTDYHVVVEKCIDSLRISLTVNVILRSVKKLRIERIWQRSLKPWKECWKSSSTSRISIYFSWREAGREESRPGRRF